MPDYDTALLWLRRDLRLGDHAALHHALKTSRRVYPVFVFDRDILAGLPAADRRVDFIHRCVVLLKADLEALGSSLIVLHGRARETIPRLAAELRVGAVFFNHDEDPAAIARDAAVTAELRRLGVVARDYKDVVIFERDELLTQAGRPFSVFTPYRNAWLKKLGTEGL
ncbi:deoxyribodipyrimidine photo-lyase, partial [Acidithiobacillus sp.]